MNMQHILIKLKEFCGFYAFSIQILGFSLQPNRDIDFLIVLLYFSQQPNRVTRILCCAIRLHWSKLQLRKMINLCCAISPWYVADFLLFPKWNLCVEVQLMKSFSSVPLYWKVFCFLLFSSIIFSNHDKFHCLDKSLTIIMI